MSDPAYQPTWTSLCNHPVPEWFRDAKFGIYTHWGPYTVPAYGGSSDALCGKGNSFYNSAWYPRHMYDPNHPVFKHHVKTFGPQNEFGYKDFIPMLTGERFDAAQWLDIFKDAGAKFVGPTAQLHDGFAMWDSKVNRWNCKAMGPKRDVTGEFAAAARDAGLHNHAKAPRGAGVMVGLHGGAAAAGARAADGGAVGIRVPGGDGDGVVVR